MAASEGPAPPEWQIDLGESGHKIIVLGYPGYFDFHVLDGDERVVVSLYGYAQRVELLRADAGEAGGSLELGGARLYIDSTQGLDELAKIIGITPA